MADIQELKRFHRLKSELGSLTAFTGTLHLKEKQGCQYLFPCSLTYEQDKDYRIICWAVVQATDPLANFCKNANKPYHFSPRFEFSGHNEEGWQLEIKRGFYEMQFRQTDGQFRLKLMAQAISIHRGVDASRLEKFEAGFSNLIIPEVEHLTESSSEGMDYHSYIWCTNCGGTSLHLKTTPDYQRLVGGLKHEKGFFISAVGGAEWKESLHSFRSHLDVFLRLNWIACRNQVGLSWIRGYSDSNIAYEKIYAPYEAFFESDNTLVPFPTLRRYEGDANDCKSITALFDGSFETVRKLMSTHDFSRTLGFFIAAHQVNWIENSIMMLMLVIDRIHDYVLENERKAKATISPQNEQLIRSIQTTNRIRKRLTTALTPSNPSFLSKLKTVLDVYGLTDRVVGISELKRISDLRHKFMHGSDLSKEEQDDLSVFDDELKHIVDLLILRVVGYKGYYHNYNTRLKLSWLD